VDATELRALGAANLAAGLLLGFPVSSSGSRTAIGDAQGSRTQVHSLVALALVLVDPRSRSCAGCTVCIPAIPGT
jgi:MFS superfamily sulfate permease-like transporter